MHLIQKHGGILLFCLILIIGGAAKAQKIGVFNADNKLIYKIKQGNTIDFRIDYKKLYPDRNDSILEARMFAIVDTIIGRDLKLSNNQVILEFTNSQSILVEREYEYTDLTVLLDDIKEVSFTTPGQSVGNAFFIVGIAAMLISPVLGLGSSYSVDRVVLVAGMGAATALIGGSLSLGFKQKPVKIKDFNGPEYFKKYQPGSLNIVE